MYANCFVWLLLIYFFKLKRRKPLIPMCSIFAKVNWIYSIHTSRSSSSVAKRVLIAQRDIFFSDVARRCYSGGSQFIYHNSPLYRMSNINFIFSYYSNVFETPELSGLLTEESLFTFTIRRVLPCTSNIIRWYFITRWQETCLTCFCSKSH